MQRMQNSVPVLADMPSCSPQGWVPPTVAPASATRWVRLFFATLRARSWCAGLAAVCGVTAQPVWAQTQEVAPAPKPEQKDTCGPNDGRLTLNVQELGAVVGYQWGQGTLELGGHTYRIEARGGGVLAVGRAAFQARGCVRNITRPEDFSGTYWTTGGAAVVGQGHGLLLMENARGVDVALSEQAQGVLMSWQVARLDMELLQD